MNTDVIATCAHCGGPVSTKGRTPRSGKRFCSRQGCQNAKARLRRQVFAVDRAAPESCSGCRKALPPRKWRSGDETGRWCSKPSCKAKRRNLSLDTEALSAALRDKELLENGITLLSEAVMADNEHVLGSSRKVCPECGLSDALSGWPHLTASNAGCWGTIDGMPKRKIQAFHLSLAWPAVRQYLSPEELEALEG